MALHHIDDPSEQAVIDTDGDEQVTMPLDYQSLTLDQVTELQKLLHKFPQLTSDKLGCTDVLEHNVKCGRCSTNQTAAIPSSSCYVTHNGKGAKQDVPP